MTQEDLLGQRHPSSVLLTTLAVIRANWNDNSRSYLDQFVPFVLEAMRTKPDQLWSHPEIRDSLTQVFGLTLPLPVIGSLLHRAARQKQVKQQNHRASLTVSAKQLVNRPITAAREDCLRRERSLIDALVRTAKEDFHLTWTQAGAEEALASYIEEHAVPLLKVSTRGGSISEPGYASGANYIISSFVYNITQHDQRLFEYLDEMVKGSMLASALYMAISDVGQKFSKTTLYFDSPLCLQALGLEGPEAQQAVSQVIDMAKAQGANVACFEHSVREMQGVLDAALASVRNGRMNGGEFAVARQFLEARVTPSDVEEVIAELRGNLVAAGIAVYQTPEHTAALGVDEVALDILLQDRVGYRSQPALERDLDSLTAIHRLREGSAPKEFERCGALLVTSNGPLVHAARGFFDKSKHEWPVAMTENDVAALLWVKQPQQYPDVPKTQVIADCITALSPPPDLWEPVLKEVERLEQKGVVTEAQVAIMRYRPEARHAVMEVTLGETRNITEKSILEAVRRATDEVSEPAERQKEEALRKAEQAEKDRADAAYERMTTQTELEDAKRQVKDLEDKSADQRATIHRLAVASGKRVKVVARIVCGLIIAITLAVIAFDQGMVSRITSAIIGLLGLFGGVGTFFVTLERRYVTYSERRRLAAAGFQTQAVMK